jgi:hypothetical protein
VVDGGDVPVVAGPCKFEIVGLEGSEVTDEGVGAVDVSDFPGAVAFVVDGDG